MNGRVDIVTPDTSVLFSMKDKIPAHSTAGYRDAMTGNWTDTILSRAFFSGKNMKILQNGIKAGVYKMSNNQYHVGNQDPEQLMIIMRSVFLQYSENKRENISDQISKLNSLVLDYAVKQVYGEAKGYMKYRTDASSMYKPISRPVVARTDGTELELTKEWFKMPSTVNNRVFNSRNVKNPELYNKLF